MCGNKGVLPLQPLLITIYGGMYDKIGHLFPFYLHILLKHEFWDKYGPRGPSEVKYSRGIRE